MEYKCSKSYTFHAHVHINFIWKYKISKISSEARCNEKQKIYFVELYFVFLHLHLHSSLLLNFLKRNMKLRPSTDCVCVSMYAKEICTFAYIFSLLFFFYRKWKQRQLGSWPFLFFFFFSFFCITFYFISEQ